MAAIEAFSGEKVMVQGAGRTDAGVHALARSRISIWGATATPTRCATRSTRT